MSNITIGEGSQGKVRRERYNCDWVAVKRVHRGTTTARDIEREYQIFMKAQHPNVVRYVCNPTLEGPFWVIRMEYVEGEDLDAALSKRMDPKVKDTIIRGMCDGLEYLHSKGIVHQDLKPANIMVEYGTFRPVIIDLGLAKVFRSSHGLFSGLIGGTPYYLAPEARGGVARQDTRSDVWAMGKIIAELLLSKMIPPDLISPAYVQRFLSDSRYCRVVSGMLRSDPAARPSMPEVACGVRCGRWNVSKWTETHVAAMMTAVFLTVFLFLFIVMKMP